MSLEQLSKLLSVEIPDKLIKSVEFADEKPPHFNVEVEVEHAYELMDIFVNKAGIYHLSTITGMEKKKDFQVIYHLQYRNETNEIEIPINFSIIGIDKEKPNIPSMTDYFVSADYYEREVYDFYGIFFDNHPFMERLILPENWPDDVRPMRKEYSWQDIKEITVNLAKKISED